MTDAAVDTPPIESTATEVKDPVPPVSEELAVAVTRPAPTPSRQALMPLEAADVVAGMEAYQALLPQLLDDSDYQDASRGKRFVKKSGWRKIARAFNLSVTVESLRVERDEDGNPTRAECVARAMAPNGQVQDGDGYCSADESRFADASGRQKLENDLRATATTRAKNRAIADLVGMGEVSAEEVEVAKAAAPQLERASGDLQASARRALGRLTNHDGPRAMGIWTEAVNAFGGICPTGVAVLLTRLSPPPDNEPVPTSGAESDVPADTTDLP